MRFVRNNKSDNKRYDSFFEEFIIKIKDKKLYTQFRSINSHMIYIENQLLRVKRYMQYTNQILNTWIIAISLIITVISLTTAGLTEETSGRNLLIYFLDSIITFLAIISGLLANTKNAKESREADLYKVLFMIAEFMASFQKIVLTIILTEINTNDLKIQYKQLIDKYEIIIQQYQNERDKFTQNEIRSTLQNYTYTKSCMEFFNCCFNISLDKISEDEKIKFESEQHIYQNELYEKEHNPSIELTYGITDPLHLNNHIVNIDNGVTKYAEDSSINI